MLPKTAYKKRIEQAFDIRNKQGQIVPFVQNQAQDLYDLRRGNWNIILKIRQTGMTSKIQADYAVDYIAEDNLWIATISHEENATARVFIKFKDYLDSAKKNVKNVPIDLETDAKGDMANRANKCHAYIGTAGARAFGRGDTIQRLHITELAWWKNTDVLKGIFDAVPAEDSRIDIESTANGFGNAFQLMWQLAIDGKSAFTPIFIGLADVDEYSFSEELYQRLMQAPFQLTDDEKAILEMYAHLGLNEGHLRFRRWKIATYTPEELKNGVSPVKLFQQEYPITPDEAFLSTGRPFFDMDALKYYRQMARKPLRQGNLGMDGLWL